MTPTPEARQRLMSMYREMPGLRLTAEQAGRLCGLEHDSCRATLLALVADGLLRSRGAYYLAAD